MVGILFTYGSHVLTAVDTYERFAGWKHLLGIKGESRSRQGVPAEMQEGHLWTKGGSGVNTCEQRTGKEDAQLSAEL